MHHGVKEQTLIEDASFSGAQDYFNVDKPGEECGVFGIFGGDAEVAKATFFGLYALQHRGQESAGIVVSDGKNMHLYKDMGLVSEVFDDERLAKLKGHMAIGHVRYSTTGSSLLVNAQPLVFRYAKGMIALAHNGNLTNVNELRHSLGATGSIFQSSIDSEVIVNLIARYSQNSIEEAIMKCMIDLKGAYALTILTENKLIGVRDPYGFRPLSLGKVGGGYVLASETCAIDSVGGEFIRDLEPGEIVIIDEKGVKSLKGPKADRKSLCIFEFIYFARPDSNLEGCCVNLARRSMGRQLAREFKVDADIVISVPDSGTAAAIGYSQESGIPFEEGLLKNRYIGRTFIQPSQKMREVGVRLKLNPIKQAIEGKRIIMIDDSIVRGTTSGKIVKMLRDAGAKEVHLCISSPPIKFPCYYGIDTSNSTELIAATHTVEEIRQVIGADSLHYLSLEGLQQSITLPDEHFCVACFNEDYPCEIPRCDEQGKYILEE